LPDRDAAGLCWFVREAWPSATTGATLTAGLLGQGEALRITARSDHLVVFGDGIEHDRLDLTWGQEATVTVSDVRLRLVG
jgi:hypothetical protein